MTPVHFYLSVRGYRDLWRRDAGDFRLLCTNQYTKGFPYRPGYSDDDEPVLVTTSIERVSCKDCLRKKIEQFQAKIASMQKRLDE